MNISNQSLYEDNIKDYEFQRLIVSFNPSQMLNKFEDLGITPEYKEITSFLFYALKRLEQETSSMTICNGTLIRDYKEILVKDPHFQTATITLNYKLGKAVLNKYYEGAISPRLVFSYMSGCLLHLNGCRIDKHTFLTGFKDKFYSGGNARDYWLGVAVRKFYEDNGLYIDADSMIELCNIITNRKQKDFITTLTKHLAENLPTDANSMFQKLFKHLIAFNVTVMTLPGEERFLTYLEARNHH